MAESEKRGYNLECNRENIIAGNMEGKDKYISYVKQAVRSVGELKVDSKDWPEEARFSKKRLQKSDIVKI